MKYDPKKPIEEWVERVRTYEYGEALKQIAAGQDVNLVMEAMSVRILNKLKHPILQHIKEWGKETYNATISQESYKKNYLDKTKRVADHMNDVQNIT